MNTSPAISTHSASPSNGDFPLDFLQHLDRAEARPLAALLLSHRRDLAALGQFLVNERLAVLAYAAIAELQLQALFPRTVWSLLEDQWQQQQARNAALLDGLADIDSAFRAAGIEYRLLKGLYLADRFYGGIQRRFTWDIDLMVRPGDVRHALDVLNSIGFAKPDFSLGLERFAPQVAHALECRRADGLSLDLHWTFRRLPGLTLDCDRLWRESASHAFGTLTCQVPSDEYVLLQLLLGVAADVDRGLCRMRAVWDVYKVIGGMADMDWRPFLQRREAEGSLRLVVNALALVLLRLDCQAEFPALAEALSAYSNICNLSSPEQARTVLARPPHSLANHLLYARWQPLPQWQYWSWWAATLPLRLFFARRI